MADPEQAAKMAVIIAAKRAEIQAKLAQFQPPGGAQAQPTAAGGAAAPGLTPVRPPGIAAGPLGSSTEIQRKIAEARARLFANKAMAAIPTEPSRSEEPTEPTEPRASGGLHIKPPPGMVLDDMGNLDLKGMMAKGLMPKPNFATVKANQRPTPVPAKKGLKTTSADFSDKTKNPYYNPSLVATATATTAAPRPRLAKSLQFIQPGKFINQANQLRARQQLKKLKQEIKESVRRAGMEVDLDVSDKSIKKEPPPAIEWWDAPLLPNRTYEDFSTGVAQQRLETTDSLVTLYIQHPIPIQPPADPGAPAPRPLMLTKKERKKLRRQRRLELQKEKQDKIRLGLLQPEQPKVKLTNLMRVLGQEAVQDPTMIEARVRREMETRKTTHEQANAERKLSEEQSREKKKRKLEEDTSKIVEVAVFKITNLSHPKHKFKVDMNAQQLQLTGCVILNQKCNLVVVEGGPKGIKSYKKLMLRRVDWDDIPADETPAEDGPKSMDADEEKGPNRCFLVWEGEVKERAFRRFRFNTCESERAAREVLTRAKVEHYWDAATAAKDEELALRQPVF